MRAVVCAERLPIFHRLVPVGTLRRHRTVLQKFVRLFVRSDEAGARAAFDRHVANRHAAFHRQRPNGIARIFEHIAGAACSADLTDDGKNNIFRGDTVWQFAIDGRAHVLCLLLNQSLCCEHMLDFGCADTVR